MCFYCCALKYIFSFLPRAPGLSGSFNSLTQCLGHENIWVFFFLVFALLCWTPPRTTLVGWCSHETPTRVVSGWFSAHPGPSLLAWYWRPPEVEKVHFPCSAPGRRKFAFFQVYTSTNNNLMSLTLLALTWGRAGRCAPCHRAALCHEELTNSLCSAGCDWNTLLQLQAGTWQPEVVAAQSFHRILFYL